MHRSTRRYISTLLAATLLVVAASIPNLTHPQLEVDEYRYLANLQELATNPDASVLDACIVENRWDHLWWIAPRATERFFRPVVVGSFYLNGTSPDDVRAFLAVNLALHLLCTALVLALLFHVLGPGWPACLGGLLFAVLACHAEALWYATGRNATLAAAGFLAALLLHVRGRRFLALLPFAFALGAKESTIVLPAVCLLYDRVLCAGCKWHGVLVQGRWLYASYAGIAVTWLWIRGLVVGPLAPGDHFPYLILPGHEQFFSHLGTQAVTYAQNLVAGTSTRPFLTAAQLEPRWYALLPVAVLVVLQVAYLRSDRRYWWFLGLLFLTWLPTSFVYVSERYIYMPSIGWAGIVALLLARLGKTRQSRVPALVVGSLLVAHQAVALWVKQDGQSAPRMSAVLAEKLGALFPDGVADKELCFVHLPDDWLQCQFLASHLRVQFRDPALRVRVLSPLSLSPSRLIRRDPATVDVVGEAPFLDPRFASFQRVDFRTGARYRTDGMNVEILDGTGTFCRAVRFRFDTPLTDRLFVVFQPPKIDRVMAQPEWVRRGRFQVLTFR